MIRVFAVEDHPVTLSGIKSMFRPHRDGIMIAGSAPNVDLFIKTTKADQFDVIILDLYIPGFLPTDNVSKIKSAFPEKPIAIFTSEEREVWKRKMMDAGVNAYVFKNADREEIKFIIRKISTGEFCFSGSPDLVQGARDPLRKLVFTDNHLEIVSLLAQGKTQTEISLIKGTGASNIEKTLVTIRKKAKVKSNFELIKVFIERGFI